MTCVQFKPHFHQVLQSLRLDVHYHRAAGNYLYYLRDDGREQPVLDLVGGYGSLLFGHNHPVLVAEAQRLLQNQCAIHAQASRREPAQRLAKALAQRAGGDYLSLFGNSGAEAVEAALKHAMLQTGSRTFIALDQAFHGKTLGALQLTANPEFRDPFQLSGLRIVRTPANDIPALENIFFQEKELAGFVFEPILGEGGVFPVQASFAQRAAKLCAQRAIPLIADECQTGMGRTGTFLASSALGVAPDYVILSKSLGGGLAKISATLIHRRHYCDDLDLKHTSTYAEDDFSCGLALKVLELLDESALRECQDKGARLLAHLQTLASHYPDVIADVRGQGLLLGLDLHPQPASDSFLLRLMSDQSNLAYLVMAYLLHVHHVRVAPTLSRPMTLRLQPSLLLDEQEQVRLMVALEDVCRKLRDEDVVGLLKVLAISEAPLPVSNRAAESPRLLQYDRRSTISVRTADVQVAWLCHLVDEKDLISLEPSAAQFTNLEREAVLSRLVLQGAPVLVSTAELESAAGPWLRFHTIMLPFTSRWARRCLDQDGCAQPLIQSGVNLAAQLGCQLVSLGQYNSILSSNGLKLDSRGMGLTTGNSYAVALARQAVERAQIERNLDPAQSTLVVVGAAGNIGRACAQVLAPAYHRVLLVGSNRLGSAQRLNRLAALVPNAQTTTDLAFVQEGHVVVVALNTVDPPLGPDHFAPNAVICDLSVPTALQPGLAAARPDLFLIKGGLAKLPGGEDLNIVGFPLPRAQVYACMAEGALLGWERVRDRQFTGSITADHVVQIESMARRHGVRLVDYKFKDVLDANGRALALAD